MARHARQPGLLAIAGTRSHRERPLLLKYARLAPLERRTDRCRDGGGESVGRCCLHRSSVGECGERGVPLCVVTLHSCDPSR